MSKDTNATRLGEKATLGSNAEEISAVNQHADERSSSQNVARNSSATSLHDVSQSDGNSESAKGRIERNDHFIELDYKDQMRGHPKEQVVDPEQLLQKVRRGPQFKDQVHDRTPDEARPSQHNNDQPSLHEQSETDPTLPSQAGDQNLIQAHLVSEDTAQSIYLAETLNTPKLLMSLFTRRTVAKLLLILALIAAVVAGAYCGSGRCKTSSDPTPVPTSSDPTPVPTSIASRISLFINDKSKSDRELVFPPSNNPNAEERALQWVIENYSEQEHSVETPSGQSRLLQRYALAALYYSTNGDSWYNSTGWLTEPNECNWYGILFDEEEPGCNAVNSVRYLFLWENNLNGTLPKDIGLLSSLQAFYVEDNSLHGTLPESIGEWQNIIE